MNTLPNPRGLVALCPDAANTVLACPGINKVRRMVVVVVVVAPLNKYAVLLLL